MRLACGPPLTQSEALALSPNRHDARAAPACAGNVCKFLTILINIVVWNKHSGALQPLASNVPSSCLSWQRAARR